ncbi:restriction endonuclease subunit S [Oceaniovalibus sp. ACAM 378]|uniref:restriction endonuclease subunit S n=1 Tax=Oceaniovalibus sp. ACAM 378 TaxID=2599923 RepID=UPI001CA370E0|nr:restriction endonuclease subunit S [Oceaniovalibus sp. ACAM 378]
MSVQLGDVVAIQTGFPFKSSNYSDDQSDPKLLRGDNIAQGKVRWDGVKRWPTADTSGIDQYWLREGDVILAMDRPWIEAGLKYCVIQSDDLPCLLVQRVARLRGQKQLDNGFLRYVIGSQSFTEHVLAVQTGTAIPHISTKQIQSFHFDLPPLPKQRAIAATLGALDDKIELNRRMNETLEAMARALFRDWFVDFGPTRAKMAGTTPYLSPDIWPHFPDRLDDEGKPEGWDFETVIDQADWINGAAYKNMHFSDAPDALPVIKIAELKNGVTGNTAWTATDLGSRYLIDDGELLFSWSGNPDTSIDTFLWSGGKAWLNQHIFAVRETGKRSKPFLHAMLKFLKPEFAELARNKQTTGLGHVTKADMKRMLICTAPKSVHQAFDELITPIFDRAFLLQMESRTLAQTRDLLLPKLISREIHLSGAESVV